MLEPIDLERARAALGYRIPRQLVDEYNRVIAAAAALRVEDAAAAGNDDSIFDHGSVPELDEWEVVGFEFGHRRRARYRNTPPELLAFGWTGVGACHYGHVLHAPELPYDDLPVAHFSPTDSGEGADLVGVTSREALVTLLARRLRWEREDGEADAADLLERLHAELGLDATGSVDERLSDGGDGSVPVPPPRHAGYRHIAFEDGIGVHAPEAAFLAEDLARPRPLARWPKRLPADAVAIARPLVATHPASALLRAKEIWFHGGERLEAEGVELLMACYAALGRDELARHLAEDVELRRRGGA